MLPRIAIARAAAALLKKRAPRAALAFITDLPLDDGRRELLEHARGIRAGVAIIAWAAAAGVVLLAVIAAGVWRHL